MANTKNELLICTCGDCDDWVIGKNKKGSFIKCMTCGDTYAVKIEIETNVKLRYQAEKPALARGRKMVPKSSRKRATA